MSITPYTDPLNTSAPRRLGEVDRNHNGQHVVSRYTQGVVPFGRGVVRGTVAGEQVKLPSAQADIFEGVAVYSYDAHDLENERYSDLDAAGIMRTGYIVVPVEEDVTPADVVRMRFVQDKTPGSQAWGFSATTTGASASGLANDATAYTASIVVDGTPNAISIVGSASQTIATVIDEINADLTGAVASFVAAGAALPDGTLSTNGHIVVTSSTTGATSSISIVDTDLFGSLTNANVAADTAVPGSDDASALKEPGMFRKTAVANQTVLLSGVRWAEGSNGTGRAVLELTGQIVGQTSDV